MEEKDIKTVSVGDRVKCKVTGIEGIVIVRHDFLYGLPRIGIQPEGSFEGKAHEVIHMDMPQAELVETDVIDRHGMIPNSNMNLGDEIRDTISGFKGICSGKAEWLYSCTKVMITPKALDKKTGKPAESDWFDEPQTERVKKEVVKPKNNTGGFNDKISNNMYKSSR